MIRCMRGFVSMVRKLKQAELEMGITFMIRTTCETSWVASAHDAD